jgi:hypothetical protein
MKRSEYKKLLLEFISLNEETSELKAEIEPLIEKHKGLYLYKPQAEGNELKYLRVIPNRFGNPRRFAIETFDKTGILGSESLTGVKYKKIKKVLQAKYSGKLELEKVSDEPFDKIDNPNFSFDKPDTHEKKKKSSGSGLSKEAKDNIKAIQRIIDPDETHTEPDGDWKSGTNRAWYEYIKANYKIINKMIEDNEGSEESTNESRLMMLFEEDGSSDFLTGEEKDGDPKMNAAQLAKQTGNKGNIAGVLAFTKAVEAKRKAEQESESLAADKPEGDQQPAVKGSNPAIINEEYRDKYYKGSNDFYYVDPSGENIYKNALKYEVEKDTEVPFSSHVSEDTIQAGELRTNKYYFVTKLIRDKDWTEITEEQAIELNRGPDKAGTKDTDSKAASAPKNDVPVDSLMEQFEGLVVDIYALTASSIRRKSREGGKGLSDKDKKDLDAVIDLYRAFAEDSSKLNQVVTNLKSMKGALDGQSTETQSRIIRKAKSRLGRISRKSANKRGRSPRKSLRRGDRGLKESKQITGVSQMKKRSLMSLVESYLNEQPNKDDKPEGGGGLTGWDAYSAKGDDHKKVAETWKKYCNQDKYKGDDQIYPGNHSASLQGFGRWYKEAQKSKEAMELIGKEKGKDFSPKEAVELLDKLVGQLKGAKGSETKSAIGRKNSVTRGGIETFKTGPAPQSTPRKTSSASDTDDLAFQEMYKNRKEQSLRNDNTHVTEIFKTKEEAEKAMIKKIRELGRSPSSVNYVIKGNKVDKYFGLTTDLNESLSRGSLYRRRYYGRY